MKKNEQQPEPRTPAKQLTAADLLEVAGGLANRKMRSGPVKSDLGEDTRVDEDEF